jgi:hypothetical protein
MANIQTKTPASIVRTINIIHMALIAGQAIFAFVMFTQSQQTTIKFDKQDEFIFIIPIFGVGSLFISNFLFKTLIAKDVQPYIKFSFFADIAFFNDIWRYYQTHGGKNK